MLFRSDRKSTRLNSSHLVISYAVFCLKKKNSASSNCQKKQSRHSFHLATFRAACHETSCLGVPGPCAQCVIANVQLFFFFNDPSSQFSSTLPLHDALPI